MTQVEPPDESAAAPQIEGPRRAAVGFIFVTILLDMLSIGMILPILPKLIESFADNNTADAARIYGLFGTAYGWTLLLKNALAVLLLALAFTLTRWPQPPGGRAALGLLWAWLGLPLLLLFAISVTGLMLTASYTWMKGYAYEFLAILHACTVIFTLHRRL